MSGDLRRRLADSWANLVVRRPAAVVVAVLALAGLSTYLSGRLTINTNQLDLISQDLRQVKDVKRVVQMVGGAGHLILALRGKDPAALKIAADDLAAGLAADKAHVRHVTHKVPTEFLRERAALFMETRDLEELRRRVMAKLADVVKRASPFFFEIRKTEPVKLDVDDLVAKYRRVGKKSIVDDYYISDDQQMTLLLIKPMWDSNELARTGELIEKLRGRLSRYGAANPHGVKLVEDYSGRANADPKVIGFGFTGSYKTNYDDSYEITHSLIPVSGFSLLGVSLSFLLFFRRQIVAVLLGLSGMVIGVLFTFGFAFAAVRELNMITCILGGILMGQGIDFAIHFTYRLAEEIEHGRPLEEGIRVTIAHSGTAALVSAAGTGAAFFSLLFSEFRGFSQFGLLAGVGVFCIAAAIFLWVPSLLILIERRRPGAARRLLAGLVGSAAKQSDRIPFPRALLIGSVALAVGVGAMAPRVRFEYNTRALMVESQPSVLLQDEINRRFQISADPVAVYTPDLEEAGKVYDVFTPLDPKRFSTVDQLASLYSFVPAHDQQRRNAAILRDWRAELSRFDRAMIPPEYEKRWDEAQVFLRAEPYDLGDVPDTYRKLFFHLPETPPEYHGVLTFIYPVVDLWDGKQMLRFADEVETLRTAEGREYHAAGLPILFAKLARIVLWDAKLTVALTALLLLGILLLDLRSLRSTLVALVPLVIGLGTMFGAMALLRRDLNFMNVVVLPIVLGYGLSHGVYLVHRFNEGTSPRQALRSVGGAVACSTLTTLAGWAALLAAGHRGLRSMGMLACLGMSTTLLVSFTIMPALLQLMHDRRTARSDRA